MIEIRHSIPGRLRLGVPVLRYDRPLAEAIRTALCATEGVRQVRIAPACGSLLVCWGRDNPETRERVASVLETLLEQSLPPSPSDELSCLWTTPGQSPGPESSCGTRICGAYGGESRVAPSRRSPWPMRVLGFVLLTGYLGFVLVRALLLKRPLAGGALSLTGIVALVAAIPLLHDAWHETVVEKRFTIHQFLAFSLLLAIGFGEAMTAFEIVYVLRGGRLLEQYVSERSRRAIGDMLALSVKDAWVLVGEAGSASNLDISARNNLLELAI